MDPLAKQIRVHSGPYFSTVKIIPPRHGRQEEKTGYLEEPEWGTIHVSTRNHHGHPLGPVLLEASYIPLGRHDPGLVSLNIQDPLLHNRGWDPLLY